VSASVEKRADNLFPKSFKKPVAVEKAARTQSFHDETKEKISART